ncbi:MAG: hypothetical protein PHG49_02730 [Candidatus Pacebacteria bacterium]|nr:hypothetical protein [Candidatus Paceibacterota bacterium]
MNLSDFDFSEVKLEGKYEKYIESNKNIVARYKKNFDKLNLTASSTLLYKYF